MYLTPRELDKLQILSMAQIAQARKAKGLKLNYPEAVSIIAATALAAQVHVTGAFLAPSLLKDVSEVFLLGNSATGVLILVALAVNSLWAAGFAAAGAVVSTLLALWFGASGNAVAVGLYGFSAVLAAVALGSVYYRPSWPVALYTLLGVVFTVVIHAALSTALAPVGVPPLTAPFVLATWLFLLPKPHLAPTSHRELPEHDVVTAR